MAFIPIAAEVAGATLMELETLLGIGEAGAIVAAESAAATGDALAITAAGTGVLTTGVVAAAASQRDEFGRSGPNNVGPPAITQKRLRPIASTSQTGLFVFGKRIYQPHHPQNKSIDTYTRKRRRFRR